MGRTWGRLYFNTRNHDKVRPLQERFPERWPYIYPLLEMAMESHQGGKVLKADGTPFSLHGMGLELKVRQDFLLRLLFAMHDTHFIDLVVRVREPITRTERRNAISGLYKHLEKIERESGPRGRQLVSQVKQSALVVSRRVSQKVSQGGAQKGAQGEGLRQHHIVIIPHFVTYNRRQYSNSLSPDNSNTITFPIDGTKERLATPEKQVAQGTPQSTEYRIKKNTPHTPLKRGATGAERGRDSKKGSIAPYSPDFEKFWSTYPNRKGGKGEAWRIWSKKLKTGTLPLILDLIAAVEALRRSHDWLKEDGKYIPMVTTFLNQGRWTDAEGLKSASVIGATNNAVHPPSKPIPNCPDCNGSGWITYVQDGIRYSRKCPCRKGDFDGEKAAQRTSQA